MHSKSYRSTQIYYHASQPINFCSYSWMMWRNIKYQFHSLIFNLKRIELIIYHTRSEHANHFIKEVVSLQNQYFCGEESWSSNTKRGWVSGKSTHLRVQVEAKIYLICETIDVIADNQTPWPLDKRIWICFPFIIHKYPCNITHGVTSDVDVLINVRKWQGRVFFLLPMLQLICRAYLILWMK